MDIEQAAARLGVPTRELAEVFDTPAGTVCVGIDGSRLVIVPDDRPDAEGKTGVMFFVLPHEKYRGTFPVYAQPLADDPVAPDPVAGEPARRGRGRPRKENA